MDFTHFAKRYWQLVVVIVVLSVFVVLRFKSSFAPIIAHEAVLNVGSSTLSVMVADTPEATYQGLSDRASLDPYEGMVFIFPAPAERTFVMRRMMFPLDIIWVKDGKITGVSANLPPEPNTAEAALKRYYSPGSVDMVLEVPSGTVKAQGWGIGTEVWMGEKAVH